MNADHKDPNKIVGSTFFSRCGVAHSNNTVFRIRNVIAFDCLLDPDPFSEKESESRLVKVNQNLQICQDK